MNTETKTILVVALAIAVVLLLQFGADAVTGRMLSSWMMGSGAMGGLSWRWLPTVLLLCLGILLGRVISGHKN